MIEATEAIAQQHDVPALDRDRGDELEDGQRQARPDPDDQQHQGEEDQGRLARLPAEAVEQDAHGHGRQDVEQRGSGHAGAEGFAVVAHGAEGLGGDVGEGGDDVDQAQPDEDQEEPVSGGRQVAAHDLADRGAAVAHRGDQAGKVVDAADEDRAEDDPQQRRQPAEPDAGQDRPDDGPGGGDGREVLSEQQAGRGRDKVLAVVDQDRRGRRGIVKLQAPGQKTAVDEVCRD